MNSVIHHSQAVNFQHTNAPDVRFEHGIFEDNPDADILLGMETTEVSKDTKFGINISTILISAVLFLVVLAWFDFMQSAFVSWMSPESEVDAIPSQVKLAYAIGITIFVAMIVILYYYHSSIYAKK